jgi:hypothetical protein
MEAANRGAYAAGGISIGLNIRLPREQVANRYLTPGLCLTFRYFALRKLHFLLRARAMVAFPGGFGTFDELFETLTLVQCAKIPRMPIVLVGEKYWRRAATGGSTATPTRRRRSGTRSRLASNERVHGNRSRPAAHERQVDRGHVLAAGAQVDLDVAPAARTAHGAAVDVVLVRGGSDEGKHG